VPVHRSGCGGFPCSQWATIGQVTVEWITAFLDTPFATSAEADTFWLAITGVSLSSRRGPREQFATLQPPQGDAFLRMRMQIVDSEHPGVHLDLHVPDPAETSRHAVSLGADVVANHGTLVVLTSPGGLRFCLAGHRGERVRPEPTVWPPGHHSLVDQVCLDIPDGEFDREASFWSSMTGWTRHPGSLPEFDYLQRPAGLPLRLLLQRVGDDGPVRAHLDLASDDVQTEVARHESLGATVRRRTDAWATLRDPAGREYCITSRDPWTGRLTAQKSAR